jgi:hypothetical protein
MSHRSTALVWLAASFWELVALASHARRLAQIRLLHDRLSFELGQAINAEVQAFRHFDASVHEVEAAFQESWSTLSLPASRTALLSGYSATIARLKDEFTHRCDRPGEHLHRMT